jgi:hypothetical protein
MAFKPANANSPRGDGERTYGPVVAPRDGSRKARVSLIVDMGVQEREDFEDPDTGEKKPQRPIQQVAVFADLTADTVDYGGTVGKAHYRMLLNKSFMGVIQGVSFAATPPKDAKGNTIQGKPWGLHPANLLSKLAKATGNDSVIESMDIEQLLNGAFMCQVEVKKTPDKNGKKDKDGNTIVYTNVNFKGATLVPNQEDNEGNDIGPMPVPELKTPALCITFDEAKKEDIKFIRAGLIKQIKLAKNYAGSKMEAAIKEYEAEQGTGSDDGDSTPAPAPKAAPKATTPKKPVPQDDMDDDVPF